MDHKLQDLIDIPLFQTIQDKLNEIYSFPSAIIDNDGNILTATAWQDICTKFHRVHPVSEKECVKSDQYILDHIHNANPAVSYRCPHGMVDNATPIIIEGKHLGNFFTGQFFLEPPDMEFFKRQAVKYGFEEAPYLEAVARVPIWSRDKLNKYLDFIKIFIEILAGIGLKNLREEEARKKLQEKEQALRESEARFRAVFEKSRDAIGVSKKGMTLFVNRAYLEMFGYERDEDLTSKPLLVAIAPSEHPRIMEYILKRSSGEKIPDRYETVGIRKNGEEFPFDIIVGTYMENNEIYTIASIRDMTEIKKTEEQIRSSLLEKETLLREVHHRVKNNMQIISSLLDLQSMKLKDTSTADPFRILQGRVHAMALIHEKLYRSKNLASISMAEYIRDLVNDIEEFNRNTGIKITYTLLLEDIHMGLDRAIPCGLIITELVTNALKHAFPVKDKGEIKVRFEKTADGHYEMSIQDNGRGMEAGSGKESSLGLELVDILTRQIRGSLAISSGNGTLVKIRFPH